MILFPVKSIYKINDKLTISKIIKKLENKLNINIISIKKLDNGQNINYKLYTKNKNYLLRIISRKGYPSIKDLEQCYQLIESVNFKTPKIVYYDLTDSIVPYGYFIQEWVEGTDLLESDDWIEYLQEIMKEVHKIKMPYFGYLNGPNYKSLKEYFYNMDKIIDNSFGDIFINDFSIWDLEKLNLTSNNFITNTFIKIKSLVDQITTKVEPVLVHGDMLPQNLIKTLNGVSLIDWDEVRAGWWVYDIARTLYYINTKEVLNKFIINDNTLVSDIYIGIKLEHIRQLLRQMCIVSFNTTNINKTKQKILEIEKLIEEKFISI